MRPMNLVLAGFLMCGAGAALVYGLIPEAPLWAVWLLGPILWYFGFAFACAGLITRIFHAGRTQKQAQAARAARRAERVQPKPDNAPVGLQHEVPPMGGFLL